MANDAPQLLQSSADKPSCSKKVMKLINLEIAKNEKILKSKKKKKVYNFFFSDLGFWVMSRFLIAPNGSSLEKSCT